MGTQIKTENISYEAGMLRERKISKEEVTSVIVDHDWKRGTIYCDNNVL